MSREDSSPRPEAEAAVKELTLNNEELEQRLEDASSRLREFGGILGSLREAVREDQQSASFEATSVSRESTGSLQDEDEGAYLFRFVFPSCTCVWSNSHDLNVHSRPLNLGNSWGATIVNRKLQEQVLQEVFSPPAFHQHRRHGRNHPSPQRYGSDVIRRDPSPSHASSKSAAISFRNNGANEVKLSPGLSSRI